jgi:hypothetical protein
MDFVFWIILIVVIVGVVWWFMNRSRSAKGPEASDTEGTRADGALSGGSAAASAEAAGTTGIAGAAGFGRPAEPAAPTTAEEPAGVNAVTPEADKARSTNQGSSPAPKSGERGAAGTSTAPAAAGQDERRRQDEDEWQTQWSEASGSSAVTPGGAKPASRDEAALRMAQHGGPHEGGEQGRPAGTSGGPAAAGLHAEPAAPAAASRPVHHPEYTEPHAPTLPGAETAAVEEADDAGAAPKAPAPASAGAAAQPAHGASASSPAGAGVVPDNAAATETADRTQSSAMVETGADHARQPEPAAAQEPAGHLAAEEPYGAGSAAAKADGSGPADYTVKGDAGAMVYYEEGHPDYEQARAEVWFESAAHAEAAGFRAPRRRRL